MLHKNSLDSAESQSRLDQKQLSEALLSVVVPVYNEEEVIGYFYEAVIKVLEQLPMRYELVFVNDGSSDKTLDILKKLQLSNRNIAILDLSRNFGKEIALTCGIEHAAGDAVVIIDADLQDPPELIPKFINYWQQGFDVVSAKRTKRAGESAVKKITAYMFYRVINAIGVVAIPMDTGDFRLLSRKAVDALKQLPERNRFMKGLFAWIGYSQKEVTYTREPRHSGHTKWNYWRLWNFALEGITSFTTTPLKISTYVGIVSAIFALIFGTYIVSKKIIFGDPVAGFPALIAVVTFLGGIQLVVLGIIGEYLGRIFDETKQRPLYFINEHIRSAHDEKASTDRFVEV